MARLKSQITPALLVQDMAATLDFYRKLGFILTDAFPVTGMPSWAAVECDGVRLQFHTEPPQGTPATPIFSGTLYFYPDDVLAFAEALRASVTFAWSPEQMPYGALEFGLQDPNGYYLGFSDAAG